MIMASLQRLQTSSHIKCSGCTTSNVVSNFYFLGFIFTEGTRSVSKSGSEQAVETHGCGSSCSIEGASRARK